MALDNYRFGSREIANVTFRALNDTVINGQTFKKNQPVFHLTSAKTTALESQSTTVYAQGGRGNPRLIAWEGGKTMTFNVTDALLTPMSLAILTGGSTRAAAADAPIDVPTQFECVVGENGLVTISKDMLAGTKGLVVTDDLPIFGTVQDSVGADIVFCDNPTFDEGNVAASGVYPVDKDIKLTFEVAKESVGKTIVIDAYTRRDTKVNEISIEAGKFAGFFYVEAETLFREESTGEDFPAMFVLPRVKIQSNITFNMSPDGDPSTFAFNMDAFPGYTNTNKTKKVLCSIATINTL